MEKKLIISGAGGFLGNNLVKGALNTTDCEVFAISSQESNLKKLYSDYEKFHVVNLQEIENEKYFNDAILINCAYPSNSDGPYMASGLRYILDLLRTSIVMGVGGTINISSQSVYGFERAEPADENSELNIQSKYEVGKYAVELLIESIYTDIPYTNIRLASLLGPGYERRFVNKLIKQVIANQSLTIVSGEQIYGFLDVRDAVDAILCLAVSVNPSSWSRVYNIGPKDAYSFEQIVQMIVDAGESRFGTRVTVNHDGKGEWKNSALNSNKFTEQFDWESRYSLDDTIAYLYDSYLEAQ